MLPLRVLIITSTFWVCYYFSPTVFCITGICCDFSTSAYQIFLLNCVVLPLLGVWWTIWIFIAEDTLSVSHPYKQGFPKCWKVMQSTGTSRESSTVTLRYRRSRKSYIGCCLIFFWAPCSRVLFPLWIVFLWCCSFSQLSMMIIIMIWANIDMLHNLNSACNHHYAFSSFSGEQFVKMGSSSTRSKPPLTRISS